MIITKDYVGDEIARNKRYAQLYTELLQDAYSTENGVLIGHHICFQHQGNIDTENEIPAADTLIFDHDIMKRVFGTMARIVMRACADVPASERDELLLSFWDQEKALRRAAAISDVQMGGLTLHDM